MLRTRILTKRCPSALVVSSTASTTPASEWRKHTDASRRVKRCATPGASSGSGVVLPMTTSSPDTRVPGGAMPSASSLSYVPCRIATVASRSGASITSCTSDPCFFSSALYDR